MNLVSMIMQLLGPSIINRLAASLGANQGLVGKAISAAVPAILAGLTSMASRGGGAAQLSNAVAKQDPSILSNLGDLIGSPQQQTVAENGTDILSSLLGGSSTNALAGALSKFAGLSGAQGSSLLGMLAPLVLGQLGQVQKSSALDAGGLANLLNSQKDNIANALPSGFSKLLGGTGILDSLGDRLKTSVEPARATASQGLPLLNKWLMAIALGVLGILLLTSYGCNQKTTEKATTPETPPAATTPAETPMSADLSGTTSKALDGLTTALAGITDEATAKAAVPQLQDIAKQIEDVKTAAAPLSAEAKKPIASLVASSLPIITAAVEKAVGIPGVAAILNPILQPLVANLEALSKV